MYLNAHTHFKTENYDLINIFPEENLPENIFSVGIHPKFIAENYQNQQKLLLLKAENPFCKAIGECGLDKISGCDFSFQKEVFLWQISVSEAMKKPLIIHCVRAFSEIISIKNQTKPQQNWLLHGFNKNENLGNLLLSKGIKLSFGEKILQNENLQRFIKTLNFEDFLIETDASSVKIEEIYQKIAFLKEISVEELIEFQKKNFQTFFKLQF